MSRYAVAIVTARNISYVTPWLRSYGFDVDDQDNGSPWSVQGTLLVTNRKVPAICYVDDRGIRFWSWDQAIWDIESFQ